MYKELLPTLLFAAASFAGYAQPTLTAATINPIAGDQFIIVNCDTAVSPQSGGTSQVWDFSSLTLLSISPVSADTVRAQPPYWSPHVSSFPSSNLAMVNITASATSVDIYDITSTSAISQDGLYYNSSSQYAQYTNPMDILHFPFSYLNNFSDNYAGNILFLGTIPANESGTINVTYDGYGTLTLPGLIPGASTPVTYTNVARVHSIQNFTDHASLLGTDTTATYELETYTWYHPGYHNALLTIASGAGVGGHYKLVSYSAAEDPSQEAVSPINNSAALNLFPNPAKGELNIKYTTANAENVHISIMDMLGRVIAVVADKTTQGDQLITYNTGSISHGLYLVRFQSGKETITRKIEIQ